MVDKCFFCFFVCFDCEIIVIKLSDMLDKEVWSYEVYGKINDLLMLFEKWE